MQLMGVVVGDLFKKAEAKIVRGQIIKTGGRIDGPRSENRSPNRFRSW